MKAHWIQHVPFEGLGSIETWLASRQARVSVSRMFEQTSFPRPRDIDLLIIMGGPMSVNDENSCPWLRGEKRFVSDAIEAGVAVLGVCLGAQMIASARGAEVRRNPVPEIGWFPVEKVPGVSQDGIAAVFPDRAEVFHWHGETFDLPPGALLLARSEACENQAFTLGRRVAGFQFHPEATSSSARSLVEHSRADLVPGRFVQQEEQILEGAERCAQNNALMAGILDMLISGD